MAIHGPAHGPRQPVSGVRAIPLRVDVQRERLVGGAVDVVLLQTGMERSSDQLVGAVFGQGEVEDAGLVRERGCVELAFRGVDLQAADDDVHGLARAGTYADTRRYPRCFSKERNHRLNS